MAGCSNTFIKGDTSSVSSVEFIPHKFGRDDLTVNGKISLGMTIDEVKEKLGQPDNESTFTEGEFIYGKYTSLIYGDMSLTFFDVNGGDAFTLGIIATASEKDEFAGGLHVGATEEEVLAAFTRSDEKLPLYFDESEESYGDYVYGSFTRDDFISEKPKSEIQYAYINRWSVDNGYSNEFTIEYYYFDPLIWNEDETEYSGYGYSLIFCMDNESGLVNSISLNYDCIQ